MGHYHRFRSAEVDQIIGGNIREARHFVGASQSWLADQLEMDPSQLSRIERGRQAITVWLLLEVARLLDVPYVRLVGGGDLGVDRPEDI